MNRIINHCLSWYISMFLPLPPQEISLYQTVPNFRKKMSKLTQIYLFLIAMLFLFSFAIRNVLILVSWGFLFYLLFKIFRMRREFKNNVSVWNNFISIQEFIIHNGLFKETSDVFLSAIFTIDETDNEIIITAYKMGNFLDTKLESLDTELSGLLALEIAKKEIYPDTIEYVFLKETINIEQSIFTSSSIEKETFNNIPIDTIMLTTNQSFSLKANTNMGIYGRTGAGKTVALQWYLYNAIAKGSGTDSHSLLSIVDGKGADLFALGEILSEEIDGNISVGQSPSSLAKLSREFVEVMDLRFELIKEHSTLNADAYDLGLTPNFLFIDEMASIRDSCGSSKQGKELWNEIIQNIGLIARKGRQAACHLVCSTQDPNSDNIPVEIRNQITSVIYLGNPSNDRVKMAFSMCELENVPTLSGRKGEALFYADALNMTEPEITIVPFVDLKTKQDFRNVINRIKPDPNNFI